MKLFSNVFPISNIKDYLGIDIYLENPRIFLTDKGSELLLIATEHTHTFKPQGSSLLQIGPG